MSESRWTRVASTKQFTDSRPRVYALGELEILVCKSGDRFFATENVCSHAEFPLADGDVDAEQGTIQCPLHGAVFDLESGEPIAPPADAPIRTFPVRVSGGAVWVDLPEEG